MGQAFGQDSHGGTQPRHVGRSFRVAGAVMRSNRVPCTLFAYPELMALSKRVPLATVCRQRRCEQLSQWIVSPLVSKHCQRWRPFTATCFQITDPPHSVQTLVSATVALGELLVDRVVPDATPAGPAFAA